MQKLKLGQAVADLEASREAQRHAGFMAGLFEARADTDLLDPFPRPHYTDEGRAMFDGLAQLMRQYVDSNAIDKTGEIPREVVRMLARAGAFGLKIPREYGGQGLTQSDYHRIATLIGGFDGNLTALLSAHNSIGVAEPVKKFGTPAQKQVFLPALAAGAISGFALTEPDAGTDITRLRKHAVRVREDGVVVGYRLYGQTMWTTNAMWNDIEFMASYLIVIARVVDDPREVDMTAAELKKAGIRRVYAAFVVPTLTDGIRVIRRAHFSGLRAIYNGEVGLEGAYVPVQNRLDTVPGTEGGPKGYDGLAIAQSILTVGRLTLPAACLGGMKQLLNMLRCFAGANPLIGGPRTMFGGPVGEHEANAEKIVRIAARTLALEAMVRLTGTWVDEHRDLRIESMSKKVIGTQWLWDAIDDASQVRGGRSYDTVDSLVARGDVPLPFERMMRDSRVMRIFEGANEAMRLAAAREGAAAYVDGGKAMVEGSFAEKAHTISFFAAQTLRSLNAIGDVGSSATFGKWHRFLHREARRLTRVTVEAFVRYQQRLEKRQLVLLELSDYAMGLFLMAATLAYAADAGRKGNPNARELADWFCADTAKRLRPQTSLRQRVFDGNNTKVRSLAKRILDGEFQWLEDGIVRMSDILAKA